MTPIETVEYEAEVASLRRAWIGKDFAAAWQDGRAITLEQAVAFALEIKAKTAA